MLLKSKELKGKFALGMRWVVATRSDIEDMTASWEMQYGFYYKAPGQKSEKLKSAAVTTEEHSGAYSLAGILAQAYEHFIYVHRISESTYWVCIIKDHEVWSGGNVPNSTAGDLICTSEMAHSVIDASLHDFENSGIDVSDFRFSSENSHMEYPDFNLLDFKNLLHKVNVKKADFQVRFLQSQKKIAKKGIFYFVIIVGMSIVAMSIYNQTISKKKQEEQQKEALALAAATAMQKQMYFQNLQNTIKVQNGSIVLEKAYRNFMRVPHYSKGWILSNVDYNVNLPNQFNIKIMRSPIGTLLTFVQAYSNGDSNGVISSDNNSGTKIFNFVDDANTPNVEIVPLTTLQRNIPYERDRLISYGQLNNVPFKIGSPTKDQYGIEKAQISLSSNSILELKHFYNVLKNYPTVTIQKVKFTVNGYSVNWSIEGYIYA